ncbi:hypothetical protein JTB14_030486 [Gonioctena quinquepunctata]|nr:hypothetical protein JTB14_030486 [Gonioctena quinquepunctata]
MFPYRKVIVLQRKKGRNVNGIKLEVDPNGSDQDSLWKWLDEADSDVDDIRKDEDELVSEHDSRSEQSADSDCKENPEDDVAELCDRDYDVAEDECAGNNVAETDSEQFGLRNIPLSEKKITIHQILAPTMMQMISLYRNYWLD